MMDNAKNLLESDTVSDLVTKSAQNIMGAKSTPESAREEMRERIADGQKIDKETAEELIKAHKEIDRLKAENTALKSCEKPQPEPKLLPELQALLDSGEIMPARARILSTATDEQQRTYLQEHSYNRVLLSDIENKKRELEAAKAKLTELESRPKPEPKIIEKIVEKLPEGTESKIKDAEDKNKKATKALKTVKALEDSKAEIQTRAEKLHKERNDLEREIKVLKSQLVVDTPSSIDNARALKLGRMLKELDWIFPDIRKEVELAGGEMHETKKMIIEIIKSWSSMLQNIDGQILIDI